MWSYFLGLEDTKKIMYTIWIFNILWTENAMDPPEHTLLPGKGEVDPVLFCMFVFTQGLAAGPLPLCGQSFLMYVQVDQYDPTLYLLVKDSHNYHLP